MDILSKILNYESLIFEEYSSKRKDLIKHVKSLNLDNLNKIKLLIFINDLKSIIDPLKTSSSAIDYYFTNLELEKNESILEFGEVNKMIFAYFLLNFRLGADSIETLDKELSEESEESDSSEETDSLSEESESNSSRSVSVTFSNEN